MGEGEGEGRVEGGGGVGEEVGEQEERGSDEMHPIASIHKT